MTLVFSEMDRGKIFERLVMSSLAELWALSISPDRATRSVILTNFWLISKNFGDISQP